MKAPKTKPCPTVLYVVGDMNQFSNYLYRVGFFHKTPASFSISMSLINVQFFNVSLHFHHVKWNLSCHILCTFFKPCLEGRLINFHDDFPVVVS